MSQLSIYLLSGIALVSIGLVSGWEVRAWKSDADSLAAVQASQAAIIKAAEDARALGITEGTITISSGAHFADVQTKIVTRTITQIKEVPKYVTLESDKACVLPLGLIRLHNAAASGTDPDPALPGTSGQPNDTGTTVSLSELAGTITENYGRCRSNAAQLDALSDWLKKAKEAWPK